MMGLKAGLFFNKLLIRLNSKKTMVLIMFLVENQREYIILNLSHYVVLSCITKLLNIEWE